MDAVGRAASANAAIAVEDMDTQDETVTTAAAETKNHERVNFLRASLAAVRKIERELAAKRRAPRARYGRDTASFGVACPWWGVR